MYSLDEALVHTQFYELHLSNSLVTYQRRAWLGMGRSDGYYNLKEYISE
jgi:hypothetical protein